MLIGSHMDTNDYNKNSTPTNSVNHTVASTMSAEAWSGTYAPVSVMR